MSNGSFEEVAVFETGKVKKKDVGNFYDSFDHVRVGSIPTEWPLEVSYAINDTDSSRSVRAYYSGDGQHPYGGNLPDEIVERKVFTKDQIQESFDYLENLITKYNATVIAMALEKVMDHWNGTKVIINCRKTHRYITETLMDSCGLVYSDDFKGDKNYRGNKPEPTPLYISKKLSTYVDFVRCGSSNNLEIMGLRGYSFGWVKQGETKTRVEFYFLEYGNGPAGTNGNDRSIVNVYSREFRDMLKDNYCFGEVIPELVEIANFCVKKRYLADFPLTQEDFNTLFQDATVVDPVKFVHDRAMEAVDKYPFEDERTEQRFYKRLQAYKTPIDIEDFPLLAKIAKVV